MKMGVSAEISGYRKGVLRDEDGHWILSLQWRGGGCACSYDVLAFAGTPAGATRRVVVCLIAALPLSY